MPLILLILIFIYLNIDLSLGGVSSPYYIATFFGAFLALKNINSLIRGYTKWLSFVFLIVISTIISFTKFGIDTAILPSLIQSSISIVIGYAAFCELQRNNTKISKYLNYLIIGLILIVILEIFLSPVKAISDSVRNIFYNSGLYINDQRDLEQFGFIRPKAFSREPSFVTGFFTYLIIPYFCFSKDKFKALVRSSIYSFLMLFFTFSIKALVPISIILTLYYSSRIFSLSLAKLIQIFVLSLILLFLIVYLFRDRIINLITGQDLSGFIRINIPAILSYKVLLNDPLFGWGFANKEIIETEILRNVFQYFEWIRANSENLSNLNNYFFGTIIYFGIIGSVAIIAITYNILGKLPRNVKIMCIVLIFILGFTQGGWITLKFWVRFYLILASFKYFFESYYLANEQLQR